MKTTVLGQRCFLLKVEPFGNLASSLLPLFIPRPKKRRFTTSRLCFHSRPTSRVWHGTDPLNCINARNVVGIQIDDEILALSPPLFLSHYLSPSSPAFSLSFFRIHNLQSRLPMSKPFIKFSLNYCLHVGAINTDPIHLKHAY